jgi:hypothetical protein
MVILSLWIRLEKEENPLLCLKWQQSTKERSLLLQTTSPKSLPGKASKLMTKVPVPENRHRWPRRVA